MLDFTAKTLAKSYGSEPPETFKPEMIAVFGQSPQPDGTPSKGLLQRLALTKAMALKFPPLKIVLSGGAVKTTYSEAEVMKKWLSEQGIAPERLLLDTAARDTPGNAVGMLKYFKSNGIHRVLAIATLQHIPRATAVLQGYADTVGYPLRVIGIGIGIGGGTPPTAAKQKTEALYTYVNTARVMGTFTKSDFSAP